MTIKTLLAAFVLTAAPGLAMATGCNWNKTEDTVMSCAAGFVLDGETGKCVAQTTS